LSRITPRASSALRILPSRQRSRISEEGVVDLAPGDEQRPDVGVEHRRRLPEGAFELVEGL